MRRLLRLVSPTAPSEELNGLAMVGPTASGNTQHHWYRSDPGSLRFLSRKLPGSALTSHIINSVACEVNDLVAATHSGGSQGACQAASHGSAVPCQPYRTEQYASASNMAFSGASGQATSI